MPIEANTKITKIPVKSVDNSNSHKPQTIYTNKEVLDDSNGIQQMLKPLLYRILNWLKGE